MENRFNLVDEPWIPIADRGLVSLKQIFSDASLCGLSGSPVQKLALMKLLLAIAQAAATPDNEQQWQELGAKGLACKCLEYLKRWHSRFYLYGEQPFLQVPEVALLIESRTGQKLAAAKTAAQKKEAIFSGKPKEFGVGFYPDLPSENNTVLSHTLIPTPLSDEEKAVFIVTLMNFAFGGKRVEGDTDSLAGRRLGNRYTAPAGPSLGGWHGQLHSFSVANTLLETLWLNLLTQSDIKGLARWPAGIGSPPWEITPKTESDGDAQMLRTSYMATLVSLSRFVLLKESGIYYVDGINYPSVKNGWYEPSLLLDFSGKEVKVKYANPQVRPWRELQSLLSFLETQSTKGFENYFLSKGIGRARQTRLQVAVWSSGLKVSSNSGDQSVKQSDDFVESTLWLNIDQLGECWFQFLKQEMVILDQLAKTLYGCVVGFFKEQKADGTKQAAQATQRFWQLCERDFQALVYQCEQEEQRLRLRRRFASYAHQAFDDGCPYQTGRQLEAWAKCRPNLTKYLKNSTGQEA